MEENMINSWEELESLCRNCNKCKLAQGRNNVVIGEGNKNAKIMFIGEGPGADEDAQGVPFVGKAGQLMNQVFNSVGIKREDVYIANIVKCRPPNNRNPYESEAKKCLDYLRNQVLLVKPEIIVLLGSVALTNILGKDYSITSARGNWIEKKGIKYMPTFHPAALLRDESKKIDFWNDLKKIIN
jgi:DNA polymerase